MVNEMNKIISPIKSLILCVVGVVAVVAVAVVVVAVVVVGVVVLGGILSHEAGLDCNNLGGYA